MNIDVSRLGPDAKRQILRKLAVSSKAKQSKYGNVKTVRRLPDGSEHEFDSRKEAERYDELLYMQRVGLIEDLRIQVPFLLIPKQQGLLRNEREVKYVADFTYFQGGELVVEDCKGKRTPEYILKRKLMLFNRDISIKET